MHKFVLVLLLILFAAGSGCASRGVSSSANSESAGQSIGNSGTDISVQYLKQARTYRAQGRYDLARQSYAKALATCQSNANLAVIEHELAGTELLIRTMR